MKVAVYYSSEDIRLEEMPKPKIGKEEVLVEMKACGLCGSDLMKWYLKSRAPLVLGHEPTGRIIEIGEKVRQFSVGDRVFVHHHAACFTCNYCIRGDYTLCDQFHRTNIVPGGLAEFFIVPAQNLRIDTFKIPESLSFEEATMIEPIGCCIRALKKCRIQVGDTVVVIGAGTTGIIHTMLSKILGATKTFVIDFIEYRLQMARKLGADVAINLEKESLEENVKSETDGLGADLVVVTAPSIEAYRAGLSICRKGGRICVFAPSTPGEYLRISPKELFFSEIQIIPSYSTSHLETRIALNLMKSGRIEAEELITNRFKLEEVAKAFKTAQENKESLKVVVQN
ncbi:MAG: zinc-dependent dehydrogenase [Candidatus Bathyarchaeota archaeon]|jgi:L-iditol 2-dehydrogenase